VGSQLPVGNRVSDKDQNRCKAVEVSLNAQAAAERLGAQAGAERFVRACQTGDVAALSDAAHFINENTVGGWNAAMRAVGRQVQTVSPEIQQAFLSVVWLQSNNLRGRVGDDRALCAAARVLLPSYQGPIMRLFRGAPADERRRRTYGLCWTAKFAVAEIFARDKQTNNRGSVLLETLAPPEAIICAVAYPEPFTQDEIARLRGDYPNVEIIEFHGEGEYVVDRRHLNAVTVVRRYA